MITYNFTEIGSDSLYEYLYKCIKNDIIKGDLSAGEKLPSKRSFARNLGISTITVENAYSQLQAEGYIYSIPKKGYYINDLNTDIAKGKNILTSEKISLTSKGNDKIIDFTDNRTETGMFPFSIWSKLMRSQLSENQDALMTNPPSGGVMELRYAIAKHLLEFQGQRVKPEQIIVGAGTEYLCALLVEFLGFDKVYGIEEPGYSRIQKICKNHGIKCKSIPMDNNGVIVSKLKDEKIDVLHVSPAHNYPTGNIIPISRRYELLSWASESDSRYIIEDGYDSEFRLVGKPIPAMENIDVMAKVIYMNSFTKTLSSTIRISYMILPIPLMEKFYSELSFYSGTVSNFEQYTLAEFIGEGYFEKHINRMRSHYKSKREKIIEAMKKSSIYEKIEIIEKESGLHFQIKVETNRTDEDICKEALSKGLRISSLSEYYQNPPDDVKNIFIINYSQASLEDINKGIKILEKIFK